MELLDMLGQPCPMPVIAAKKALAKPGATGVVVQVDNTVAVQNLQKMANGLGYTAYSQENSAENFTVTITIGDVDALPEDAPACAACQPMEANGTTTVLISSNAMGSGSEELGRILIKGFLFSLTELPTPPQAVLFINSGALLTTRGADTVPDLITLAEKGTRIYTCGTCANYFNITENLAVGEIANMMEITTMLAGSAHLITL